MPQVDPSHNLKSLVIGTGEFSFAENATSAANAKTLGWLDFGNVLAVTPQVEVTTEEHFGSYRGVRRKDKTLATQSKLTYELKLDEMNKRNLLVLFGATETTQWTQTVKSAVAGDAWAFNVVPSGAEKWWDVLISGVRVRGITALTIPTLVEGTDFFVDQLNGRVRFAANQVASRTPTVTAPAITATDNGSFWALTPFGDVIKQGYGRLTLYDQNDNNKVVLDHQDFSCDIKIESFGELNGQNITEITMSVTITDTVGTIYSRYENL